MSDFHNFCRKIRLKTFFSDKQNTKEKKMFNLHVFVLIRDGNVIGVSDKKFFSFKSSSDCKFGILQKCQMRLEPLLLLWKGELW